PFVCLPSLPFLARASPIHLRFVGDPPWPFPPPPRELGAEGSPSGQFASLMRQRGLGLRPPQRGPRIQACCGNPDLHPGRCLGLTIIPAPTADCHGRVPGDPARSSALRPLAE